MKDGINFDQLKKGDIVELTFFDHYIIEKEQNLPNLLEGQYITDLVGRVENQDDIYLLLSTWDGSLPMTHAKQKDGYGVVKSAVIQLNILKTATLSSNTTKE